MIKAVIFDFGNVICSFDNKIFLNKIAQYSYKSAEELKKLIFQKSEITTCYEKGEISTQKFINEVIKLAELKISKKDFISAYTNIFTPLNPTINLIMKLKLKYKLGLISNTSKLHFDYCISKLKIFNLFDAVSLSFKVKVLKPDKKIFYNCLNKLKLRSEECVYIDDIQKYVHAAKGIGMQRIQFTSYKELRKYLRNLKIET